jgi:hypothetical protein
MFRPIARSDAEEISRWRYPEPYATYNGDPSSVPGLLDPRYNYHAVTDPDGELVGYFCFGADATVPAGRRLGLYDETPSTSASACGQTSPGGALAPSSCALVSASPGRCSRPRLFASPSRPSTGGP